MAFRTLLNPLLTISSRRSFPKPRRGATRLIPLLLLGSISAALAADVNYSYDPLGRLSRVDYASGKSIVYNYDAAGNRTQVVYNGGDAPPVAVNDAYSVNENSSITRDPRLNDSDPDNDPLTITAAGPASHGTVVINSGTTIKYTPTTGFHGTDSFTYKINDGHNPDVSATVTMTVINRAPTATTDNVSTNFNTAKQFDPRSNDSDPDGDALTITAPTTAVATAHGSVTGNSTSVTYTPTTGYSGPDTFTYTISDGQGHTANGTVNVTVSPANRAPTAVDDTGYFHARTPPAVTPYVSLDPRSNDTDPDGDSLTVTGVTNGSQGTVVITGGGTGVTYTYNSLVGDLETTDTFTYTISDGHNHTATGNVTVTLDVTHTGN